MKRGEMAATYTAGDGLGVLAATFFDDAGQEEAERASRLLKEQPWSAVEQEIHDPLPARDEQPEGTGLYKDESNIYAQNLTQQWLKQEERKHQQQQQLQYTRQMEQCRVELLREPGVMDTVHPNKLKSQAADAHKITNVRHNLFMDTTSMAAFQEPSTQGVTGSSLGYGAGNPTYNFTLSEQKNEVSQRYDQQMQPQRIGNSQFSYTQNYKATEYGDYSYRGPSELRSMMDSLAESQGLGGGGGHRTYPTQAGFYNSSSPSMHPYSGQTQFSGAGSGGMPRGQPGGYPSYQQQTSASKSLSQPSDTSSKYFYESPSKYISLKKFSQDVFQFSDAETQSIYASSKMKGPKAEKEYSIQSWFKKLLNHEKAIVLTVIDSDLVSLVRNMHVLYSEWSSGFFSRDTQTTQTPHQNSTLERVADFNVLFKRQAHGEPKQKYDYYGPQSSSYFASSAPESKTVKEQRQSEDNIISNINIIKIGNQEALTLNNYLLENTDFILKMMQTIDPNFMMSELKIEKAEASQAMSGSVLSKEAQAGAGKHDEKGAEAPSHQGRKQQNRNQDVYFTLNERDLTRFGSKEAGVSAADFRARTSQYNKQGIKGHPASQEKDVIKDKTKMTLGKILCHIFEKAINVQYQEFQNRLTHPMKDFFFIQNENHLYSQDLKFSKFWQELQGPEHVAIWEKINQAQEKVITEIKTTEEYKKQNLCEEIKEDIEENTDSEPATSNSGGYYCRKGEQKGHYDQKIGSADSSNDEQSEHAIWQEVDKDDKKITKQSKRLAAQYVDWEAPDDPVDRPRGRALSGSGASDEARALDRRAKGARRREPLSDDTDSNDIENQRSHVKNQEKKYMAQGYRRLGSGPPRSAIKELPFKGNDLNSGSDDDKTETENSSANEALGRKNVRGTQEAENDFLRAEPMRAIYSTAMDKNPPSEGEEQNSMEASEREYPSNYETDEFEQAEDPEDDFHLPRDHEQNAEPFGRRPPAFLKMKLQEELKENAAKAKKNKALQLPAYTSSAAPATTVIPISKRKATGKTSGNLEESKQEINKKS